MAVRVRPPGYKAPSRRDQKAVTIYVGPKEHAMLLAIADVEGSTLSEIFNDAVDETYGPLKHALRQRYPHLA